MGDGKGKSVKTEGLSDHLESSMKARTAHVMVFSVILCGWESWTMKKQVRKSTGAFELWH